MIPFFQYNIISWGPITIQVWGLMVALGIVAAVSMMRYLCKKYVLSFELMLDITMWALISAFLFARIFHVVFYNPSHYTQYPLDIFKFWHGGASSLGGFLGALLAMWLFTKWRNFSWTEFAPYTDIAAVSLWLGWGIGRIGCFLIHDHPGTLSHFLLAVRFPSGTRHDLGLYESITGFLLFIVFFLLFERLVKRRWGLVATFSPLAYAVIRFFTDFLRASDLQGSDARYGYLTPAQWGMLAVMFALTSLLIFGRVRTREMTK